MKPVHAKISVDDVAAVLRRGPVTMAQIAARFGFSRVAARSHLKKLRRDHRVIEHGDRLDRTYEIVDVPAPAKNTKACCATCGNWILPGREHKCRGGLCL